MKWAMVVASTSFVVLDRGPGLGRHSPDPDQEIILALCSDNVAPDTIFGTIPKKSEIVSTSWSPTLDMYSTQMSEDVKGNTIPMTLSFTCVDSGEVGTSYSALKIDPVNNREPMFNSTTVEVQGVTMAIPIGFSLRELGYNLGQLFFYDLDHAANNATDTAETFVIEVSPNDLFEVRAADAKKEVAGNLCESITPGSIDVVNLDLKLLRIVPGDIPNPYEMTITVRDSNEHESTATVTIEFLAVDRFPPKFGHPLYTALLDTRLSAPQNLSVQPEPIKAVDGDTNIDAPIQYSLLDSDSCSKSFDINSEGVIAWNLPLDLACVDEGIVKLLVQAKQEDNPDMSTTVPCVVQLESDLENPQFGELPPSAVLNLWDGSLDPEIVLTATDDSDDVLEFSICEGPGSDLFQIGPDQNIIVLEDFDPATMSKGESINLVVQVEQKSNAQRASRSNIPISYFYNFEGPMFNSKSYYFNPINPAVDADISLEGNIDATDTDGLPIAPTITYSLSNEEDIPYFTLGSAYNDGSPRIVFKGGATESDVFVLNLQASETGVFPEQSSLASIVIELIIDGTIDPGSSTSTEFPIVDRPAFEEPLYTKDFLKGYQEDPECVTFKAKGSSGDISYSIRSVESEDYASLFAIDDSGAGVMSCKKPVGIESFPENIIVTIRAEFNGGVSTNDFDDSIVLITIRVPGDNQSPQITSGDFGRSVTQHVGYPTFIYLESFVTMPLARVMALDPNQDPLTFSIQANQNDQSSLFQIDTSLGFIYALPSEANNIGDLCPTECKFAVQVTDGISADPVSVTMVIQPLGVDKVIGMEIKKDGSSPGEVLDQLNTQFKDELWFIQVQYQPGSAASSQNQLAWSHSKEGPARPLLIVTVLNKGEVFITEDQLVAQLGVSDLVDVSYEYTIHTKENVVESGNSEALLIVVIILAILLTSSVIGLIVFFLYFKKKRDQSIRDDSSTGESVTRANRFARPDTSPTKSFNRASTFDEDPTRIITSGTQFSAQKEHDSLYSEMKSHLSQDNSKPMVNPEFADIKREDDIDFEMAQPFSELDRVPKRKAPSVPPPPPPPSSQPTEGLKRDEDSFLTEPMVTPPLPKTSPPPLDRKISFNESAEVIRVLDAALAKESSIAEEALDNGGYTDDSNDEEGERI
eukprot:maker-scaffold208_size258758-snap-gene-1.34 protein:Tk04204 transcript:maker-scaffold208_size258758-snap-gene-1.34-mRNA-1 annotation:"protocadherin fat 4"